MSEENKQSEFKRDSKFTYLTFGVEELFQISVRADYIKKLDLTSIVDGLGYQIEGDLGGFFNLFKKEHNDE